MELEKYIDRVVVIDTSTPLMYIGTVKSVGERFIELVDADVHDVSQSTTGKDVYLIGTKKDGVKKNRASVLVRYSVVTSVSLLSDIVEY